MAEAIIMPRQGQSVESCIFSEWFIKKGEKVKKGDLLFAYETDKASFEQEAPADGLLLETFANEGDEIPVLETIGIIGEAGEDYSALLPSGAAPVANTAAEELQTPAVRENTENSPATESVPASANTGTTGISPRARNLAMQKQLSASELTGTGPQGRIIERDVQKALEQKPKATPLARAIAERENISLPEKGSGPLGKIRAADVKIVPSVALTDDYEDKKVSNIRRIIAQNMYESLANTAQLTLHASADARKLQSLRNAFKRKAAEGYPYNVTINDLVCFAIVKALQKHSAINAHYQGDTIRTFRNVHLGFAVDTSRGLMVPTVKSANHLSIEGISENMKALAKQCQQGSISPEVLQGATFTVSNLGAFGIEMFTPVLNPPQVGILGINTIRLQPGDVGDGIIGFVPRIGLSLTFDHRALDGAPAAAFLKEVCSEIENLNV
ncbi:MAG: 2-oxo acid dehydrogenase subunit E2 [Cyclobacteriaceae bacterium]|nr:2-oxo acid dehydrogenase subunit E2 [Cyclobacteriaceae bacterium]